MNARETATVLAALRYWQREGLQSAGHEQDIACDGGTLTPLTAVEIDALAERINIQPDALTRAATAICDVWDDSAEAEEVDWEDLSDAVGLCYEALGRDQDASDDRQACLNLEQQP